MRKLVFVGFVSILLSSACDGSSTGGSAPCGSFTPCGGNITGTWQIASTCLTTPDAGPSSSPCSDTGGTSNLQYKGSFTFRTDGTYSVVMAMSGSMKFTYTAECLSSTMGMTCEEISARVNNSSTADAGVSASCSPTSNGGCACTETLSNVASTPEDGTYTTSGSTLVTTPSDSSVDPTTAEYCVQGNRLTIRVQDSGAEFGITATK